MHLHRINILLVDDQEDDYIIFKDIAERMEHIDISVDWVETVSEAIRCLKETPYDICFVDYRLRKQTGLDVLKTINQYEFHSPVVMLTSQGDYDIDMKAMQEGAADYLEKGHLSPALLERSIRYAIERNNHMASLKKSEHRLRIISTKLIQTQEEERKKIAQELHDNIGSSLTAIKLGLENLGQTGSQTNRVGHLVSLIQNAMNELRHIYTEIRPVLLDELGIVKTIYWYCRKMDALGSNIDIDVAISLEEPDIPVALKIILFRILQESLTNIHKHSRANHVMIHLAKQNNVIHFEISDNGIGFDATEASKTDHENTGLGLESMKERTEYIGGSFYIHSQTGKGTTIKASWNSEITHILDTTL